MHSIYNLLITIHVSVGFVSLILFWVPIASQKGSSLHIRSGNWYVNAMYVVAFTALILGLMLFIDPIATKFPNHQYNEEELFSFISRQRQISLFLLAISILVLSNIRHGLLTLKAKSNHSLMRAPSHLALNTLLVATGITLLFTAAGSLSILFYIFAALTISIGVGNLRYCLKSEVPPMEWMISHLGSMIGAGIGSYTAFFVFGGSRFFAEFLSGQWMLVPWVLPGVAGGLAITLMSRKYSLKYKKVREKFLAAKS